MKRYYVHEVQSGMAKGSVLRNTGGTTWSSGNHVASQYSRMKYGDPEMIRLAAKELFNTIVWGDNGLKETFLSFPIAITNSARTVPTASFTIMKILVEDFLNPWLRENESSEVVWVRSGRAGKISEGDYGKLSDEARAARMAKRRAFFEREEAIKLHGRKVILFDDLIATGSYEKNQTELLLSSGVGRDDIIPLYWFKIEDHTAEHNPSFEATVNHAFVKKMSDLLAFFLEPELVINARTMKYIFSSEKDDLLRFFSALASGNDSRFQKYKDAGRQTLLKIYYAAKSSDGYWKMDRFKEGFGVLNDFLLGIGSHPETVMRHKVSVFEIDGFEELPQHVKEMYSCFKYGDPVSVRKAAGQMLFAIEQNSVFRDAVDRGEVAIITSSAYGEIPTAADAIARDIRELVANEGCDLEMIKINRSGDFGTTAYGQMSEEERIARMASRKITIDEEAIEAVEGKVVLVIDDLNATGSHETTLWELLKKTNAKHTLFCYLIDFSDRLASSEPHTEEMLNHAKVKTVADLIPFFTYGGDLELRVNARTIKFILETGAGLGVYERSQRISELKKFLLQLNEEVLRKIFNAAYFQDGYYCHPKFVDGFNVLVTHMAAQRIITIEEANQIKNYTVDYNVTVDDDGNIIDIATGENLNSIGEKYSLMKFGGRNEIEFFGKGIAKKFIERLNDSGDDLLEFFQGAKERGENIMFVSPGSRNVESSQNFIYEVAIKHINVYLALNGLPTIILTKLSRLGSNVANYATLPMEERMKRPSKTKTILPGDNYFQNPTHIVFGDDTRITGSTADRVELHCLTQGAKSFLSMYCVLVDPKITAICPDIESYINDFLIKGGLDEHVAYILSHQEFTPVQRMVRLILSEDNRDSLEAFLKEQVCDKSITKLYLAALGNDYLNDERYAPSIPVIRQVLQDKELVDQHGMLK
ncbi:phosphoribosyltransferase family protein [Patescibacteria group bacterium]